MVQKIGNSPILPTPAGEGPYQVSLHSALYQHLMEILPLVNASIVDDGSQRMAQPFTLASFNVADLPDPSLWPTALIFVPDESGGPTVAFSDGADWFRIYDNALVS